MSLAFENKRKPLAGQITYYRRIFWFSVFGAAFIIISLFIGAIGYHWLAELDWIDSFYNASMILTGMGPAIELKTDQAKVFVTVYSIYSGVAFLTSVGVIFAPIIHRFFHRLHLNIPDIN